MRVRVTPQCVGKIKIAGRRLARGGQDDRVEGRGEKAEERQNSKTIVYKNVK